jgi:hypothetical protein
VRPGVVAGLAVLLALGAASFLLHDLPGFGRASSFEVLSGAAFGAILQRSRFCFASAFRDLYLLRSPRVALGVLAALAVGSLGYLVVLGAQLPDPRAGYPHPTAHIAPVGWHLLLGGASFGLGMVLAGGCISGHLYRLGEGSLLSLSALGGVLAGFGGGFLAWNFLWVKTISTAPLLWLPAGMGYGGAALVQFAALAVLFALLLRLQGAPAPPPGASLDFREALRRVFRRGWPHWIGGAAIGLLATFTFLRTEPLGVTAEIGRLARRGGSAVGVLPARLEGLEGLKGCRAVLSDQWITDSGVFISALVAGSLAAALLAGEFRPRPGKPRSHLLAFGGGILLGFGAMISLGCTVGTLLSGIMAFSLSGWVFAAGLAGGAWAGSQALRRLA